MHGKARNQGIVLVVNLIKSRLPGMGEKIIAGAAPIHILKEALAAGNFDAEVAGK